MLSRYPSERLPNVVKEAMYQNCVIVTTYIDGVDELVEHEFTGFVIGKGDYTSGVNYIFSCLQASNVVKSIAEAAKLVTVQDFDVGKSMQKYCQLWASAAKEKRTL